MIIDFKRVTYFELFRRAGTSARISAPKLRKRFWDLVTVILDVPKKSKLAITDIHWSDAVGDSTVVSMLLLIAL